MSLGPPATAPSTRQLPHRLEVLLPLMGRVDCLADVGTDHALLPAHAVLRGVCQRAIAVDVREEPLRRASETLLRLGVSDRVTLLRGDGLAALDQTDFDVVVLAGLGGRTLLSWCRGAPAVIGRAKRLIVQPNRQLGEIRSWAYSAGLWLVDENICREGERFFSSCAFAPGSGPDPAYAASELSLEQAFELGPWLVRRRVLEAGEHWEQEATRLRTLVAAGRVEHASRLAAYEVGCHVFAKSTAAASG
jgi:tRNA (adenine22-N1)-methyltransferase